MICFRTELCKYPGASNLPAGSIAGTVGHVQRLFGCEVALLCCGCEGVDHSWQGAGQPQPELRNSMPSTGGPASGAERPVMGLRHRGETPNANCVFLPVCLWKCHRRDVAVFPLLHITDTWAFPIFATLTSLMFHSNFKCKNWHRCTTCHPHQCHQHRQALIPPSWLL